MKYYFKTALLLSCLCPAWALAGDAQDHYQIYLTGRNAHFDMQTGLTTIHDISRRGLVSVIKRKKQLVQRYWQAGAFRQTIALNDQILINGKDVKDLARISSFKMAHDGSHIYLRTTKGPHARVRLILNGDEQLSWPRGQIVRLISFTKKQLILSIFDTDSIGTKFYSYQRKLSGQIAPQATFLGELKGCALLSARLHKQMLYLQSYCDAKTGSDILQLEPSTGKVTPIATTQADEVIISGLSSSRSSLPILKIEGNENGRTAFHAISGIFLADLGEPASLASDEAGRQSWSQSYRLRILGLLAQKTGHGVFARLAIHSMHQTLAQQNATLGLTGPYNPNCGWASRIYSSDGKAPISLMVNQAMIATSLISSCNRLGESCPTALKTKIFRTAQCLVRSQEPWFDQQSGLYRIPYRAPFRFDGIWAPWNWQMMWAPILSHVGQETGDSDLQLRATRIADRFLSGWEIVDNGALWRYWTPEYFAGWTSADTISTQRPKQKHHAPRRYEDINHAGISLLGLNDLGRPLTTMHKAALGSRIDNLLTMGITLPRDLDGKGPRSPRWLPGGGFANFPTQQLKFRYSRKLPGGISSDQHLGYAALIDNKKPVELKLTLLNCTQNGCQSAKHWSLTSLTEIVTRNPLFTISSLPSK